MGGPRGGAWRGASSRAGLGARRQPDRQGLLDSLGTMVPRGSATTPAQSPAASPLPVSPAWADILDNQDHPIILASHSDSGNASGNASLTPNPGYIAYILIPFFFFVGLLGVLICHILKKRGYRCTTEAEQEEEVLGEKIDLNETTNENDTVGHIVDYIMKNEANADVLKAMVADNSVYDPESPTSPGSPTSPVSPSSPGGLHSKHHCRGHHLHTVGGVAGTGGCSRCNQKRWHLFSPLKKAKEPRRFRHGEVTVLSVGRFRVTKVEQKSGSKERKTLMSVSGVESVNGEMPATPVREGSKEGPVTPVVKRGSKELCDTPVSQEKRERTGTE